MEASSLSLVPLLYLLGAAQGAFLAMALFSGKERNLKANRYLGCLILVFVVVLIDYVADYTAFSAKHIWASIVLWPKEFLFGPLIYLYVREISSTATESRQQRRWPHFILAALHAGVSWPLLLLSDTDLARHILDGDYGHGYDGWAFFFSDFELLATQLQLGVYLLISLILLQQHQARIQNHFSYSEGVNLRWLQWLICGLVGVYFIWLAVWFSDEDVAFAFSGALGLSIVALIYVMGFRGLRQPLVFAANEKQANNLSLDEDPEIAEAPDKYSNSSLSAELSQALMAELSELMASAKPYLDPKLSLPQLADKLGVSVNYLSQVINEQGGQNFFEFINRFRIAEAIRLMEADKQEAKTILDIGLEAGFNSKSAFYAAFKKHRDMTPGQFRKSLN